MSLSRQRKTEKIETYIKKKAGNEFVKVEGDMIKEIYKED